MEDQKAGPRFKALFKAQLTLAALLFCFSVYTFARGSGHGEVLEELGLDDFLMTVLGLQLRVVPAYLMVAFAYTVLLLPLVFRSQWLKNAALREGGRWRLKALGLTALWDVLIYVVSLGPFFRHSPGLVDGTARLVKSDVYFLYRWHVLDGILVAFFLLCAISLYFYGKRWVALIRKVAPAFKVALILPVALCVLWLGLSLRTPTLPKATAETPMNVLIIASDSLRYDHLGVHGYHRQDISPNIDAFAADAVDFEQLHVATASTLESWVSFMTSQFPPNHGVRYMYLRREQAEAASKLSNYFPRVLNKMGYHTTVVSNWAGNCFKLVDVGFTANHASDTQNLHAILMEATIWPHLIFPLYFSNALGEVMLPEISRVTKYLRPAAMTQKMLGEIDGAMGEEKPFFGLLFFSTTHLPYTAGYPFNIKYGDPDYDGPHRYEIEVTVHDLITTGFDPDLKPEVIQHIKDLYDGAVSDFDHHVGEVIADLKARGLYDKTIIIITSDHGEDLYDKGSTLGHGTNFFGGDQSTRIPFFIRVPGVNRPGAKVKAMTRNIDIAPTLMNLMGGARPDTWDGVDLSPLIKGETEDLDLPVFGETCYLFFPKSKALVDLTEAERAEIIDTSGARDTLVVDKSFNNNFVLREDLHDTVIANKDRMIRTRRWKLVHVPGKTGPIYRLYDMLVDPYQRNDLSKIGHPVMPKLIEFLDAYWSGRGPQMRWPPAFEDPQPEEPQPTPEEPNVIAP